MRTVLPLVLLPALLAGCATDPTGDDATSDPTGGTTAAPTAAPTASSGSPSGIGVVSGTFTEYTAGATAITYATELVPPGATAELAAMRQGDGVRVHLAVTGLRPRVGYGAHLHTNPCGASPDQAGPHYQHQPDPAAVASPPSVDPRYANPDNEVWLDFTTDATGAAEATATQQWQFDGINPPRSLVLHAERTRTGPGEAGMAGDRVACLTLPD